jgi:F-box interacting protein
MKPGIRIRDMDGNIVRLIEGLGGLGMLRMTSLDDLICVANDSDEGVHVVDPATGEVLITSPGREVRDDGLHPYHLYTCFCLGRAAPSGVYKMVRLGAAGECDVLALGDAAGWRKARTLPFPNHVLNRDAPAVAINGIVYFMTQETPACGTLLCFDLEKEMWKDDPIEGPRKVVGDEMWGSSTISAHLTETELNGALCIVQREHHDMRRFRDDLCTNIWIMDDSDEIINWTRAFVIPMSPDLYGCYHTLVRVIDGGERLLLEHAADTSSWLSVLQVYHLRTKTCTDVPGGPASNIGLCNLHLEHLVSIKN